MLLCSYGNAPSSYVALCVDNGFGLQVGTEILAVMLYSGMLVELFWNDF